MLLPGPALLTLQMTPGGRWWQGPPPSIVFPMTILSQVRFAGKKH